MAVDQGFRDFIKKFGVGVAFGLVTAWAFRDFLDALIDGLIKPLIDLALGYDKWVEWTVVVESAELLVGKVLSAAVDATLTVMVLFLIVHFVFGVKKIP